MTTKILKQCVGIDCSKDNNEVCFGHLTKELDVVYKATASFPNNEKGFKALAEWMKKLAYETLKVPDTTPSFLTFHFSLSTFFLIGVALSGLEMVWIYFHRALPCAIVFCPFGA